MSLLYPKICLICHDKVMYPFIFCCPGQCIRFIGNAHLPMGDFDSRCQNCNKALEATRQMCAGCKVARYCNRSCQKKSTGLYTRIIVVLCNWQILTFIAKISCGRRWCNRRSEHTYLVSASVMIRYMASRLFSLILYLIYAHGNSLHSKRR